jgi:hypothetical protein
VGYQSYVVASMVSRPSSMAVALIHAV